MASVVTKRSGIRNAKNKWMSSFGECKRYAKIRIGQIAICGKERSWSCGKKRYYALRSFNHSATARLVGALYLMKIRILANPMLVMINIALNVFRHVISRNLSYGGSRYFTPP